MKKTIQYLYPLPVIVCLAYLLAGDSFNNAHSAQRVFVLPAGFIHSGLNACKWKMIRPAEASIIYYSIAESKVNYYRYTRSCAYYFIGAQ
jgi:hypothetical protein